MNKKNSSKSGMFMMEMIAVVFFFILCAGICILVFVRADKMSRTAEEINKSVNMAQSIAEYLHGEKEEGLTEYFGAKEMGEDTFSIYFDHLWNLAENEKIATYTARIDCASKDGMDHYTITFSKDLPFSEGSEIIYSLDTSVYRKDS